MHQVSVASESVVNMSQFKQLEGRRLKTIRLKRDSKPVTSTLPARCSANWYVKPHIGNKVNILSSYLSWGVKWCKVYMKWFIFEHSSLSSTTANQINLVPRVSHLTAPRASEERPWFGLVTCYYDNWENQGSSVIRQFVALNFVALRPPLAAMFNGRIRA